MICDQLSAIGKPVDDITKMFGVLEGLGPEYEGFRTTMYCMKPQPEHDEMISQLERFDTRLQSYSPSQFTPTLAYYGQRRPGVFPNSTFASQQVGFSGGRSYGRPRGMMNHRARGSSYSGRSPNFRPGNLSQSSSDLHYQKQNAWPTSGQGFRPYAGSSSRYQGTTSFPTPNVNSLKSVQDEKSVSSALLVCQICKRPGHDALRCWYRFDNAYQPEDIPTALTALHLEDPHGSEWYPDTGASAHITADSGTLYASLPYHGTDTVMIGNGACLPVVSTGNAILHTQTSSLPLHDVLVVPEIKKNLLSVSKLTHDYPCSLTFDNVGVYLKDLSTNKIVQLGRKHKGLYKVDSHAAQAHFTQLQRTVGEDVWHQRLAHTNFKILKYMKAHHLIQYYPRPSTVCESCQLAKSEALPFSLSECVTTSPLAKIHCDLWGPSPVTSIQNFRYYVIFVDDFSRYSWIYPMRLKSEFCDIFMSFQKLVETQLDQKIKVFQCDGGGEFLSHKFKKHLLDCGIKQQFSCPYTPEQNGVSERKHRHVVELGLAMLYHAGIPLTYWVDAFLTANHVINLLPTPKLQMESPHQKLYLKQPHYAHLRVFGCRCFPCLRPYSPHKLAPRSLPCVFLGYSELHKGYRCLLPTTGRIYVSRHVIFDENLFPFSVSSQSVSSTHSSSYTPQLPNLSDLYSQWTADTLPSSSVLPSSVSPQTSSPVTSSSSSGTTFFPALDHVSYPSSLHTTTTSPISAVSHSPVITDFSAASVAPSFESSPSDLPVLSGSLPPVSDVPLAAAVPVTNHATQPSLTGPVSTNAHSMQTRSKTGVVKPNPRYACLVEYNVPAEPKTVKAALAHEGWTKAMHDEMTALSDNATWELVPRSSSMNVVGCKWVFKTKLAADGSLDRLKARLVAKGFHQEEGIDFNETFSPVIKHATIRIVLSVAVMHHWSIRQLDVKNAFLHGHLSETVHMEQPPGFVDPLHPQHVCLLKKSLYGLKQAPRAWFDKFSSFLLEMGFFCSATDPSLFICHKGSDILLLLLYVDDIILTGSSDVLLTDLITSLHSHFHMKDLGPLHYFLGIEVKTISTGLFLCQSKYAVDLLTRAQMKDCRPISTPLASRSVPLIGHDRPLLSPIEFRSLVGGLQYLTLTRPDISYATNRLCQKLQQPTVGDYLQLKRVLRYIKGTPQLGLFVHSGYPLLLAGFSDADWAGCPTSRRSTSGFCTYLGSNLISWSAKRQPTVSRSSTEAEYRSLASATADLTWIGFVLRDIGLGLRSPPILYCDNKSAIALTANPILHARTKHIEVDFHFVRERVASGVLRVCYVPGHLQLADLFTKPLDRLRYYFLRTKLGLGSFPTPNLRGTVKDRESEKTCIASSQGQTSAENQKTPELRWKLRDTCANISEEVELENRYAELANLTE